MRGELLLLGHKLRHYNSGLSTVVGGALIVGVILSVIAPLFIYMNNLTNFYDTISTEMRDLDQQRTWEMLGITVRNSTYGENRTLIFITNHSPIAVNITRIWFIPSISDHRMYVHTDLPNVTADDLFLYPEETLIINDDVINEYIEDEELLYDVYDIKFATERGNYFIAEFLEPTPPQPGYYLPLAIDGTKSSIDVNGSTLTMDLTVDNWMEDPVNVSYIVVTTLYTTGGTPSQIKILNADSDNHFPTVFPIIFNNSTGWMWSTVTPFVITQVNSGAVVAKVELVSDESYIIGAYYFIPN